VDIFFISTGSDLSGAPQYVRDLVIESVNAGYKVAASLGGDGPILNQLSSAGVYLIKNPYLNSKLNPINDFVCFVILLFAALRLRPKIIHCHCSKAGMHGRIIAAILCIPVLFTVHGWGFGIGRKKILSFLIKNIESILIKYTSHYIAVSDCDRDVGINILGINESKITTIYVGVKDLISFRAKPIKNTVVMVARFTYQKDHETLFRAINGTDIKLILIGHKTDSSECKNLAQLLCPNNYNNISFMGEIENVYKIASCAQIFVLTSRYEGLPAALIEAQSMGIPTVATNVGGNSEIISDGNNGHLFSSGDFDQLRFYLLKIINNNDMYTAFSKGARISYEAKFRYQTMIFKIFKLYDIFLNKFE
jgi:glycosyltransferase involved in cell wall biosynthesis